MRSLCFKFMAVLRQEILFLACAEKSYQIDTSKISMICKLNYFKKWYRLMLAVLMRCKFLRVEIVLKEYFRYELF